MELLLSKLLDSLVAFCHKAFCQKPIQWLQLLVICRYPVAKYQEEQLKLFLKMDLCKAKSFCQR